MDTTQEEQEAPSSSAASVLPNWKELCGAVTLSQGAEAVIHEANLLGKRVIVKERFVKTYRHPTLDEKINKKRVRDESRILVRARQYGVDVPALLLVDQINRLIWMERISGVSMKVWCYYKSPDESNKAKTTGFEQILADMDQTKLTMDDLAKQTGQTIAKLHKANIIHGDLTTSNFMMRKDNLGVVVIDFGLAYNSALAEDRAVDLYVLERAFLSTHTEMTGHFQKILDAYAECGLNDVINRLNDVRMRGRKKIAFG